jgi:hypothetical protein
VDVKAWWESMATHSDTDGQETSWSIVDVLAGVVTVRQAAKPDALSTTSSMIPGVPGLTRLV